jgi:6-phosphogluconolactonase (cycloisomerase 2 family)
MRALSSHSVGRRGFLKGLAGSATAIVTAPSAFAAVASEGPTLMYVGSFTRKDGGHGEGISIYRRSSASAPWTLVDVLRQLADPSFLITDHRKRFVYSSHGDGTEATAYRIDRSTGRLTIVNRQPTRGVNGAHLSIDGSDRFLAVANYASGSLALLRINDDGSLAPVCDSATMKGKPGPHKTQQESSHPHHCPFDRTGRFVVVPDKGLDKVFVYRLDAAAGRLVPGTPADVASRAGAAPRHVDFHPTQPYAYVINELDSTITAYQFNPDAGELKPIQIVPTLPSTFTGDNSGAEIVVAQSGRFLYGSNRGHDSIVVFAIDQSTGLLSSVGWAHTQGRTPRFFGLDPSGLHLYAANQATDTIVIFRVDEATGKLAATGEVLRVATPTTIAFA